MYKCALNQRRIFENCITIAGPMALFKIAGAQHYELLKMASFILTNTLAKKRLQLTLERVLYCIRVQNRQLNGRVICMS